MTSPSRVVWFIWKWCCCSFQELCLTFYFRKLLTIIYYLNSSFQSSFLFSQVWRNTKRKQKYQVKGIFPWICFFLGFFSSFFNSSCWWGDFAGLLMLLIPKWIQSCKHPSGLCFPSCCFCRILISFGCVNLLEPLNQHHSVCTVSAHLVTLTLRESTLWTRLVWFVSVHWDINNCCILSLPRSLTALFSPIWLESAVPHTASSPCLNVLTSSCASLSLLCALTAREAASITAVNPALLALMPHSQQQWGRVSACFPGIFVAQISLRGLHLMLVAFPVSVGTNYSMLGTSIWQDPRSNLIVI